MLGSFYGNHRRPDSLQSFGTQGSFNNIASPTLNGDGDFDDSPNKTFATQ